MEYISVHMCESAAARGVIHDQLTIRDCVQIRCCITCGCVCGLQPPHAETLDLELRSRRLTSVRISDHSAVLAVAVYSIGFGDVLTPDSEHRVTRDTSHYSLARLILYCVICIYCIYTI